jgi:hypothetical protein
MTTYSKFDGARATSTWFGFFACTSLLSISSAWTRSPTRPFANWFYRTVLRAYRDRADILVLEHEDVTSSNGMLEPLDNSFRPVFHAKQGDAPL